MGSDGEIGVESNSKIASLSWSGVVGNRFSPGSKFDEGVIGGVKLEGVLLRVLYIVVEIAYVNL